MKHLFWLLNSALLILTLSMLGFIFFSQPVAPEKVDIEPEPQAKKMKTATAAINIRKIYEDDLFDTYQKEFVAPEQKIEQIKPIPEPPRATPISIPQEPRPQFLDPLNISLRGIIFVYNDDSKNRAIIVDNKTSRETSYKVGDMIEDAQLVRIFNNKILLIRSNGQQEVLYLREKDAKMDPAYAILENWHDTIVQTGPDTYTINIPEFVHRVSTLAQFIDMLDLTTVYKEGKSIGCRVGQLAPNSLGTALGLQKGDVIIKINDTMVNDTNSRFEVFKSIMGLGSDSTITATIIREGSEKTFSYYLTEIAPKKQEEMQQEFNEQIMKQQIKHLEEKKNFAPTLKEMIERERKNMLEKSARPSQNVLSNIGKS